MTKLPPSRKLTIVAKDPGLKLGPGGAMAFAQVDVPAELLAWGPTGYRIKVVDYNATEKRAYRDRQRFQDPDGTLIDPFAPGPGESLSDKAYQARLLADPNFHAQNCYAIAMRTLGLFERALGRRVPWSSGGHQLHIAPHAFAQANAFYSEPDRALMFGYFFDTKQRPIFTALSHDIVAHETTHAVLDGLRTRFTEASGPDQAAFHEGFADIVALLSIFSLEAVVAVALGEDHVEAAPGQEAPQVRLVLAGKLTPEAIRTSILTGVAAEVGTEIEHGQRKALRRSIELEPNPAILASDEMREAHNRGEVLVAPVMRAFVDLWCKRVEGLGRFNGDYYNLDRVVEEGAKVAAQLLQMCIRALDYCPPTDLDFAQYLASLLTADAELVPDDSRFGYRRTLADCFAQYGIVPPPGCDPATGCWPDFAPAAPLNYGRSNYDALTRDRDEFFRFLWENRDAFGLSDRGYTEVVSVDCSLRVDPDGIPLRETVCQYVQIAECFGGDAHKVIGIAALPDGLTTRSRIEAFGGGTVVLDQYGQVKYHIANRLQDGPRQLARLEYLSETGQDFGGGGKNRMLFAMTHQRRMGG